MKSQEALASEAEVKKVLDWSNGVDPSVKDTLAKLMEAVSRYVESAQKE